ncbi:MAG: hypothetical protein C0598_13575 [Marinilabiliales bacterium]|nr:MAG: hypothetical protein C0598_13575 [Marinilabiliales bacterium]
MKDLFYMGGPLFMSILTILLIIVVFWIIFHFVKYYSSSKVDKVQTLRLLKYGRSVGLFALVTGILGQLIGIYMAFSAIEMARDISPAIVFGGIKISMITTLYGILIYLISLLLWFVSSMLVERK